MRTVVGDIRHIPDGIAIDHERKHIWWTNMGDGQVNDGSIHRCDVSGENIITIVPTGTIGVHTPKQCIIAARSKKLYWCDREGMRVMRANLDGSEVETLIISGQGEEDSGNAERWCVGISVDERNGKFYWTQKGPSKGGKGRIFRANTKIPAGESPDARSDVEILFDNLPEPIDLELDEKHNLLYWTDRGAPPRGNTINRTSLNPEANSTNLQSEILVHNLHEGIGIALDLKNDRMFFGDLEGSIYVSDLNGSNEKRILTDMGDITGVAYIEM
ncbi:hypothetical protein MBLNU459_g0644t1 [Dothideomycetes sp. NU459]